MILTATSSEPGMATQRFEAHGRDFTIGRGADCDWCLPDPTRQLSKRHCRMAFESGVWRVTDLSSNGMSVNGRTLTPGVSHPLQTGDRLGMGGYEIGIGDLREARAENGAERYRESQPFGDGREGGRLVGDPFVSPEGEGITDPFDVGLSPFFEDRPTVRAEPHRGGSVSDDVSDLHRPFEPPRTDHMLLPDNWDAPLDAKPAMPDADDPFADLPFSNTPIAPLAPERPIGVPEAQDAASPPAFAPSSPVAGGETQVNVDRAPDRIAPAAPEAPAFVPPVSADTDDGAARAFAAFARGAGLEGMPHEAPEEALEKLGRAFRAYVVGLRRLLIARAAVKGEFRLDRTMIRPFGNNPIKFATDDNDAMSALLGIGRQVGMSAEQAVADSIRDVREHELALNQAFQYGIKEVVAEMSPEQVADALQAGPFDAIPVVRDSRRWKMFKTRHARLQASLENNLDSVFGQAFARGYEKALSGLSESDEEQTSGRGS
ncbi:type VI secretion system-associated FHA domain protein TagH [Acetobacteraceae bacterium KSS8]|uniref:Type VI secretion system-associated FHA domain protein TagH n=1 Tax=Endosaccharibacter trunci TaxID=2812733 RepID=A0ABT1W6Y6_9PROT|nr:type VI secretion system-associated FHA domain protein TagH [Acetobacteraceae bacterium KSS8]